MTIGIEDIAWYLPEKTVEAETLCRRFGFPEPFVKDKIGVHRIYVSGSDEYSGTMAVKSVERLLEKHTGLDAEIEALIVCTQTPDFQLPHTSAVVHRDLGLKKDVACFDLNLGCSGFVYGLSVACAFMRENRLKKAVLVTTETYSKIVGPEDRATKPLFSDAAAATLLGESPALLPLRFTFGTDGTRYDHLILPRRTSGDPKGGSNYLHMDGRGIYNFAMSTIPDDVDRCLSLNSLSMDDIDYFVFHQATGFLLNKLAERLGLQDGGRMVNCISTFGNTVSASIPIALKTIWGDLRKKKNNVLISGFGVGLSWSSTVLQTIGEGE
jgi:3-oxoacyl-[acyl-carrier-protein] synthase-3